MEHGVTPLPVQGPPTTTQLANTLLLVLSYPGAARPRDHLYGIAVWNASLRCARTTLLGVTVPACGESQQGNYTYTHYRAGA